MSYGDMVGEPAKAKQEIPVLKAGNSHLQIKNRHLQEDVTYHKELLAVKASQGKTPVAAAPPESNIPHQICGLLAKSGAEPGRPGGVIYSTVNGYTISSACSFATSSGAITVC